MEENEYQEYIVSKLRKYVLDVLKDVIKDLNVSYLDSEIESYSLKRMPVTPVIEQWIIPICKKREVYNFISRKVFSNDLKENLLNIGFFENFEKKIKQNNKNKILPDIKNIEKIECLNPGTIQNVTAETSVFSIQIQITYREES